MAFNEDTRVKIPAILHLTRLGYDYLSLKEISWDKDTNIFPHIFIKSIVQINEGVLEDQAKRLLAEVSLMLDNEDLGEAFYNRLVEQSGIKLIDFEQFENNTFNVVTELTCKKEEEEFRPDITLLINGMPLVFIEVKKPNNKEGILAERKRMNERIRNKNFRKFLNITQLMIFSNNMEYNDQSPLPLEGAFYAATSYQKLILNYFREEETFDLAQVLSPAHDETENLVLKDNNYVSLKYTKEFITNKNPSTPTNRICTSMLSKARLAFILQFAMAYVKEQSGTQKHIMRYPQLFATKAIAQKLDEGVKKGIIWHTQGSGKTALAYYNVKFLTHYFKQKGIIPKFYFIVDRLDLLIQASKEFRSRGLLIQKVRSRDDFARSIKSTKAIENDSGADEITVVNIQKFKDDPDVVSNTDYNVNLQRVYFLDEVHRSYNPKGSFLANLRESDPHSIKIGLTGTPLINKDFNSKQLFGNYIHKYYYNKSIADGYTLRLIREEVETSYKLRLTEVIEDMQILKGDADRKFVYSHHRFVEPMLDYIISDFEKFRTLFSDNSIGAMVVCDSSDQAKMMFEIFEEKYANEARSEAIPLHRMAAEPRIGYNKDRKEAARVKSAALILHDIGTKKEREDWVEDFKEGKIDVLFVYNMLLTGFDAKRLKKLYVGRVIKAHNLLQMLTRVNRTYKAFKHGYVVDFADIQSEFDKTNKAYFEELQTELGDEMQHYSNLFLSADEIETQINTIKDILFRFDINNATIFSQQIQQINDRKQIQDLVQALNNAKSLYNLIRLAGHYDLLERLDFRQFKILSREANNRLTLINTRAALDRNDNNTNILNIALEEIVFAFTKVKEEELILADQLKNTLQRTREALASNLDPQDPELISLKEELERLFRKKNLSEVSKEDMERNIVALDSNYRKAKELHRLNELLRAKYDNDMKYARIHKRLMEKGTLTDSERKLFEALNGLREAADTYILQNSRVLENESFVTKMMGRLVIEHFKKKGGIPLNMENLQFITKLVVKEYINESKGTAA